MPSLTDPSNKPQSFTLDVSQQIAADRLQKLHDDCRAFKAARSNAFKRLLIHTDIPRGVYLWGGVGRGKSFLMDRFYSALPYTRKIRIHFHEFMHAVHAQLDQLKGLKNPLDAVAERFAHKYRLLCFDEFHVSDIADAMILYRLLDGLFARGVIFVITSNYEPDALYPNGLQRERFLPAIELIKQILDVLNVDAGIDYRQRVWQQMQFYYTPLGAETDRALRHAFNAIAETADENPLFAVQGRTLRALRRAGGIVWFNFATLCGGPRSQNDYLELTQRFHTLIVSDVPCISASMASEARRFTWLIDVLYDRRIKLILSAEAPPEQLYVAGALANEFRRTVSRILEMQSREYIAAQRRLVINQF